MKVITYQLYMEVVNSLLLNDDLAHMLIGTSKRDSLFLNLKYPCICALVIYFLNLAQKVHEMSFHLTSLHLDEQARKFYLLHLHVNIVYVRLCLLLVIYCNKEFLLLNHQCLIYCIVCPLVVP